MLQFSPVIHRIPSNETRDSESLASSTDPASNHASLALAETIFKFDYQFDISVALKGILSGTLIVVIARLPGTRSVLAHPLIKTLREGAA